MADIDELVFTLALVLLLGVTSYLISRKAKLSYIFVFIILGLLFGPVLNVVNTDLARKLFDYVRVFGLVIILFTEGHNLKWYILKKHLPTIGTLDTLGLIITAVLAGLFFSYVFHLPFIAGFLYGAIISATDPATLIPLFHQYKVRDDLRIILESESIFNDPLGIVLTSLAVAFVVPQAPSAQFIEYFAQYMPLSLAALSYFLYEVIISIILGVGVAIIGYLLIRHLKFERNEEIILFALGLAFIGFYIGEKLMASGYLVATTLGIILGNHHEFFRETAEDELKIRSTIDTELHFNEVLSMFAAVFIFLLLGMSIRLDILITTFLPSLLVALGVVLLARPIACLPIIPIGKWSFKEYLFISLEGPRGVVPSVLASLPLSLGIMYNNPTLISWGEVILSTTLVTIIVSIILETSWLPFLRRKLLGE